MSKKGFYNIVPLLREARTFQAVFCSTLFKLFGPSKNGQFRLMDLTEDGPGRPWEALGGPGRPWEGLVELRRAQESLEGSEGALKSP